MSETKTTLEVNGWTNWRKTTLTDFLYGKAYVSGLLTITNAKLAVEEWLSGKLVAGSEKANSNNEVILKLLHELKDGENKNE